VRSLQPPQLARPLALVVNSLPALAPGLSLHLEAPFIMMNAGPRGGLLRRSSSNAAAAEGGDGGGDDAPPEPDAGFSLHLATRKLAVKGVPRRRGDGAGQQGQGQQPASADLVARDLAAWLCATRVACLEIDTSAPFPTPQPIPLFQQRGVLYTLPTGARAYNSHQHGEDGGRALADALAPFCGGSEQLQCRLLAPERVLLERGEASAGDEARL